MYCFWKGELRVESATGPKMTEEYQSPLKKLPPDATPEQIDEVLRYNKNLVGKALAEMEHSRHHTAWLDTALYVIIGGLSLVLAFRVGIALWSGRWNSLGALDFRLWLAWLFGTLCALRNQIRKSNQKQP